VSGSESKGNGERGRAIIVSSSSFGVSSTGEDSVAAAWIAARNSFAVENRSSGRFAIARATTASNCRGTVIEIRDGGGASVCSAFCMIDDMLPSNGRSPVSN
jgi:hypothetical protein